MYKESVTETKKRSRHVRENANKKQKIEKNLIFNKNKHRTQSTTRKLNASEELLYIKNQWTNIPLSPSDRIPSKATKIQQGIFKKNLFIGTLIREARIKNKNNSISEIPLNYIILIDHILNKKANNYLPGDGKWIAFGQWLGMKSPIKRRNVIRYLKSLLNNNNSINNFLQNNSNPNSLDELKEFEYMVKAKCIVNQDHQTLVHLEKLDDQDAITQAAVAINDYYFHTLDNASHRSNEFWERFAENFGAFARNNTLPYTSSNMASTHNTNHQECVDKLILSLKPLSDSINRFAQNYYNDFYKKLSQLNWGPFAPRSFGIFPMISINYNIISKYHLDKNDHKNSLAFLVVLGQVLVFSSRFLKYGNLKVTKGIRHNDNDEIQDYDNEMKDFNNDINSIRKTLNTVTKRQTSMFIKANKIRNNDNIIRAKKGLKAEDNLLNIKY
ncbi:hypothetical protein GLOIN_2v1776959 [Rhizophagus irregularis DAOM 181602=DAOM 197198]|uniref:Uncharacterized protein n=1 Tax=Rhizophagus irregularis (strain DAOM 181602 / DAOM 197198 / MUCL 43194) TaxID=747089 RepID=A0A2P4PVV3_RHIID|nr:hypothetical protein GLOIN_2v1776959 [Rhizophagus irregularis DAOM 181602=DAOM 197198]POG69500.1 hypothetical protein GLOIN_2v1776959 [Rhizophagus irregularis DAOM 181602=DAOM 197198]|eukprot:XP_025176366.1 hypothetical protein GLOIN_2v1776959 [Rhizophagus irregularis DAOM 181602=DAOM 197198]